VVFPEKFKEIGTKVVEGAIVALQCNTTMRDERFSLQIENIKTFE
jgi:hypothetical protein